MPALSMMPAQVTSVLAAAQPSAAWARVRDTLTPRQQLYGALALTAVLSSSATVLCYRAVQRASHRTRDGEPHDATHRRRARDTTDSCDDGSASRRDVSTVAAAAAATTRPAVTSTLPTHTRSHATSSASSAALGKANNNNNNNNTKHDDDKDTSTVDASASQLMSAYESEAYVMQYLEFHYTPSRLSYSHRMHLIVEAFDFPVRMAQKFRKYAPTSIRRPRSRNMTAGRSSRSGSMRVAAGGDDDDVDGSNSNSSNNRHTRAAEMANDGNNNNNDDSSNNNNSSIGGSIYVAARALDIGCAAGASTLEMARYFAGGVIGIDRSAAFVRAACAARDRVRAHSPVTFAAPVQGELCETREVVLPAERSIAAERCHFYVADCMHLYDVADNAAHGTAATTTATTHGNGKTHAADAASAQPQQWHVAPGEQFDGVLCANVLDRVPSPTQLLHTLVRLLRPGGVLVLSSPYSWHDDITPREEWLGARYDTQRSEAVVKTLLGDAGMELVAESDEPFLLRTHVRHYQLGFAHCTVWRRRGGSGVARTPPAAAAAVATPAS